MCLASDFYDFEGILFTDGPAIGCGADDDEGISVA